ncbi:MAG: putative lipoprotein [Methylococcaceae bacterium]|nr:putative lipoprotein [Methylococcaceae bacterium]
MNHLKPLALSCIAVLAVSLLSACSFSKSSESSSDSSKGIFDIASSPLSSGSDSSRSDQEKFEGDVADYTAEFVVSSTGTLDTFRSHVGELAEKYGITDWENDRQTYLGIGRGLSKANLGKPQVSAFTESLSNNDPMKKQTIEEGMKK